MASHYSSLLTTHCCSICLKILSDCSEVFPDFSSKTNQWALFVPQSVTPATHLMNNATVTNPLDYRGTALPLAICLYKHFSYCYNHTFCNVAENLCNTFFFFLHCIFLIFFLDFFYQSFYNVSQIYTAVTPSQVYFHTIRHCTETLHAPHTLRPLPVWTLFSLSKTLCRCVLVTWRLGDIWWMSIIPVIDSKWLRGFLTAVPCSHIYKSLHKQNLPLFSSIEFYLFFLLFWLIS